jgi:hypothetical protein
LSTAGVIENGPEPKILPDTCPVVLFTTEVKLGDVDTCEVYVTGGNPVCPTVSKFTVIVFPLTATKYGACVGLTGTLY